MFDSLLRLKTGGTDIIDIADDLFTINASVISQSPREKIGYDHDGIFDWSRICQQCDDTVKMANSTLPEVAAIAHARMTHIVAEENEIVGELLQAQDSDRELPASATTVGFSASLRTYYRDGVLVQKAPVHGELHKYVQVALRARILYLSH